MRKCYTCIACVFFLSLSLFSLEQTNDYAIEIRDAPLADVVRLLAEMRGKNVVIPPTKPDDMVTAVFPSISLKDALSTVLESKDLGEYTKDDVIRIVSKKELETLGRDLVTTTIPLKYAKAKELKEQLLALISLRGSVLIDDRTNSITLRDTQQFISNITNFISRIDRIDRQVLIEARLVEATSDFSRNLGIQWGFRASTPRFFIDGVPPGVLQPNSAQPSAGTSVGSSGTSGTSGASGTTGTTSGTGLSSANTGQPNYQLATPSGNPLAAVALGFPLGAGELDMQLSAGEENGKVSTLSRPTIVTMNNRPATIRSGLKFYVRQPGSVSIATGSSGSAGANSLQQVDAGITMVVTPQLTAEEKINLTINVTESQPDFSKLVDGIPTISDNNASTTVLLEDGETTVIGGMFQLQNSNTDQGIPVLYRIPILGKLFGTSADSKVKKELLIFIRPIIVRHIEQNLKQNTKTTRVSERVQHG